MVTSDLGDIGPIVEKAKKNGLGAAVKETHKMKQFEKYVISFAETCYGGLMKPVIPDRMLNC